MKVFTRYPALAPAILNAGLEPVLLEPLHEEPGRVKVEHVEGTLVVSAPVGHPLLFEKAADFHGWTMVR